MKFIGKVTLFDTVEAAFVSIGNGPFQTVHMVITDTATQKVLNVQNFVGLKTVLSAMSNTEVSRPPVTPETLKAEIDDVFVFNPPLTRKNHASCERIQQACRELAHVIAEEVPEGKEQVIAINNLLATALWSRQGITRRQVLVIASASPESAPADTEAAESTSPASPS